jgi:hypothetical protein
MIFCLSLRKASRFSGIKQRNTLSILRINPPKCGGGLKFEPDAEIVEKGYFMDWKLGNVGRTRIL